MEDSLGRLEGGDDGGWNLLPREDKRQTIYFGDFLLHVDLLALQLPHGLQAVKDLLEPPSRHSQRLEQRDVNLREEKRKLIRR